MVAGADRIRLAEEDLWDRDLVEGCQTDQDLLLVGVLVVMGHTLRIPTQRVSAPTQSHAELARSPPN